MSEVLESDPEGRLRPAVEVVAEVYEVNAVGIADQPSGAAKWILIDMCGVILNCGFG